MAISEEGNLDLNDTTFNKGLAMFMSSIGTPTLPNDPPALETETIVTGPPMLNWRVRKWGQYYPYNIFCPTDSLKRKCATGCTPLAMAQIMTFFKHPESYKGNPYDWNKMINGTSDIDIALLIMDLGNSNNLKTIYGYPSSRTEKINIRPTFINFNYCCFNNTYNLSENFPYIVLNSLLNKEAHPVLMNGICDQVSEGKTRRVSHAWVADGVMSVNGMDKQGNNYQKCYLLCVWGWDGKGNGYFLYKFDNKLGGYADKTDKWDTDTTNYKVPVFYEDLYYWKDFSPK